MWNKRISDFVSNFFLFLLLIYFYIFIYFSGDKKFLLYIYIRCLKLNLASIIKRPKEVLFFIFFIFPPKVFFFFRGGLLNLVKTFQKVTVFDRFFGNFLEWLDFRVYYMKTQNFTYKIFSMRNNIDKIYVYVDHCEKLLFCFISDHFRQEYPTSLFFFLSSEWVGYNLSQLLLIRYPIIIQLRFLN